MNRYEWLFPALLVLPFLFSTTEQEVLRLPSELGRWLVLAGACGLGLYHGFGRGPAKQIGLVTADFWVWVILLFFAMSSFWSIDPFYSFQRSVSCALLYGATFWYLWDYADRRGETSLLQIFLRTTAVILGLNLLLYGLLSPGLLLARRFQGIFENPNNLGLICAISLPLVFAELFKSRSRWNWFCFGVFALSLLLCGSRTGLVAALAGMIIIWALKIIRGNRMATAFGVAMFLLITALLLSNFFQENIAREETVVTLSNRTLFWELAKEEYIPARPWLGHGFGTDGLVHDHYGVVLSDLKIRGYGVMSSYYGLAVAIGIPAAVFFFLLVAFVLVSALIRFRKHPPIVALAATIVAGLLVGITESAICSVGNCFAYLFWTVFALLVRRLAYRDQRIRLNAEGGLLRKKRRRSQTRQRNRRPQAPGMPSPVTDPR
ncbi:hypothetical protein N9135_01340 [Akkermansiaceae bacterium]|nr:hypothetical protein [Akkermansiaceae bacterium]MDB4432943.1 hypothetical protein [Akkermansiaceae bacterium]